MIASATQHPALRQRGRVFLRPGISLIEIIVVLAIAGVLGAIATPRLARSAARQRAVAAAKRVAADLAYARSDAMTAGAGRRVFISPLRGMYEVQESANPVTLKAAPYRVNLGAGPYQCKILGAMFGNDAGEKYDFTGVSESTSLVVFDGYGTPDTAGRVVVGCGDVMFVVELSAAGRVTTRPLAPLEATDGSGNIVGP